MFTNFFSSILSLHPFHSSLYCPIFNVVDFTSFFGIEIFLPSCLVGLLHIFLNTFIADTFVVSFVFAVSFLVSAAYAIVDLIIYLHQLCYHDLCVCGTTWSWPEGTHIYTVRVNDKQKNVVRQQ